MLTPEQIVKLDPGIEPAQLIKLAGELRGLDWDAPHAQALLFLFDAWIRQAQTRASEVSTSEDKRCYWAAYGRGVADLLLYIDGLKSGRYREWPDIKQTLTNQDQDEKQTDE